MTFWSILKIIHSHTPKQLLTKIIMTAKAYMVNKKQKTIHRAVDRNTHKKIENETRVINDGIQKGENIVRTRYGRTIRKPDRFTYQ